MTLDELDDATAAAAFRRLVMHLRHRQDAQNIDLMGLSGFCRNCLSEWVEETGGIDRESAREAIYGEPYDAFKARQPKATPGMLSQWELKAHAAAQARSEARKNEHAGEEHGPSTPLVAEGSPEHRCWRR